MRFVAKRHILQQKCLNGQIQTCLLGVGTRWYNFSLVHRSREPQCTGLRTGRDRQTDRQTDDRILPIADHTVRIYQYDRLTTDTAHHY